jgi:hypothetical protein
MLTDKDVAEIRGYLGVALDGPEPPQQDLASVSIARGDAARRRHRIYGGAGVALSAVAVLGTFLAVSGSTPPGKVTPTRPTSSPSPSVTVIQDPPGRGDKLRDIDMSLPGLLQSLVPPGITVEAAPGDAEQAPGSTVMLTGAPGANMLRIQVQTADGHLAAGDAQACSELLPQLAVPGRGCTTAEVAGGRLFSGEVDGDVKDFLGTFPDDAFKPGMANATYAKNYFYAFAPDQQILTVNLVVQTMDIPWAAKKPKDWPAGYAAFPPDFPRFVPVGNDPDGTALLTSSQFAALLTEPGWNAVVRLLDPAVPAGQSALALRAQVDRQIAAKVGAMLPTGVRLVLSPDYSRPASLALVGPTGTNTFFWSMQQATPTLRTLFAQTGMCNAGDSCSVKTVAGGKLAIVTGQLASGGVGTAAAKSTKVDYTFMPDDRNAPMATVEMDADPGVGPQLTPDQFMALVRTAGFGDGMQGVYAFVSQL